MFKLRPAAKKKSAKPKPPARAKPKAKAKVRPKTKVKVKPKAVLPRKRPVQAPVDVGIGPQDVAPAGDARSGPGWAAAEAAIAKKATDVLLLDVRELSGLCDQMLVATARSVPHLQAVADGVEEALRLAGERVVHRDGLKGAEPDWVLLDYGDLMVHLFRAEARQHYALEDYYAQARILARWKND